MAPKVALILSVGMTPSVVTEMIAYIDKMEGVSLTDICLLYTDNPKVSTIVRFLEGVIGSRYPKIRVHPRKLPFSDIRSDEDNLQFMKILRETIEYEKDMNVKKIYLSISGGRKDMSASSVVVASLTWVDGVFHVIHSDVEVYNIHLEMVREEISEIGKADNPIEAFENFMNSSQKAKDMEMALFPDAAQLTYIEIPFLPYPPSVLYELKRLSSMGYMSVRDVNIDSETMAVLARQNIILIEKETVYLTQKGERMFHMFYLDK